MKHLSLIFIAFALFTFTQTSTAANVSVNLTSTTAVESLNPLVANPFTNRTLFFKPCVHVKRCVRVHSYYVRDNHSNRVKAICTVMALMNGKTIRQITGNCIQER